MLANLLVQTVALAAHARGLGTCIMTMAARYPSLVCEVVPAVTHKKAVIGLAVGYPDTNSPVNRFPRDRVAIEEFVHFAG
jgi:nitroreductase